MNAMRILFVKPVCLPMQFVLLFFLALALSLPASAATIEGVRLWSGPDQNRLVFDLNGPVKHKLFVLHSPERVVVDIKNARLLHDLSRLDLSKSFVHRVRSATHNGNLRVVLDMRGKVQPKSFLLKPTQQYGHRLVVDLQEPRSKPTVTQRSVRATQGKARDVIIAIDAGHGGDDPGASGRHGTREKDVVLAIAQRLERLIRKERGMQPVMIRTGDYYISLRKRMQRARDMKADLFISIHADAFRDGRARGASVWVLSQKGATSEAGRWLEKSENSADLIGGVSLDDKDDLLASVLLDLSQNATIAASLDVGGLMLGELKRIARVHKPHVEQAGFVVLKSPDIPSILVETGFISNSHEERNLRDPNYQRKLANAMLRGVRSYFIRNPPPGSLLALKPNDPKAKGGQKYVIRRGDTLSGIAQKYRVSQKYLRTANNLSGDGLKIGQTLHIPVM